MKNEPRAHGFAKGRSIWAVVLPAAGLLLYFLLAQLVFGAICPLQITVGFPCPACGVTRAGVLLAQGQFAQSFAMHPLLLPAAGLTAAAVWAYFFRPRRLPWVYRAATVLMIFAFILYIYRMAAYFPHTEPMILHDAALMRRLLNHY